MLRISLTVQHRRIRPVDIERQEGDGLLHTLRPLRIRQRMEIEIAFYICTVDKMLLQIRPAGIRQTNGRVDLHTVVGRYGDQALI